MRRAARLGTLVSLIALALTPAAAQAAKPARSPTLYAGAGRADITPPTGYYMMGWVHADAQIHGQHTRLYARVLVLRRGDQKVALVAEDLNGIPGGMLKDAADLDKDLGYSERNVLDSASHTHSAPAGFYNFPSYNTIFMTTNHPTDFHSETDTVLYTFMVKQLAKAIRRADADLGPATTGWGRTELLGITRNRSIEAHLADHGILVAFGKGSVAMDPFGYAETIDPEVHVLRVDKLVRDRRRKHAHSRRVPIGMWSTFADHGTVNKFTFDVYNADHHGSATRVVEAALRTRARKALKATGHPHRGQEIVNAYGNTDEGDMSAGLDRGGPAYADEVGRDEAAAMLRAWKDAGRVETRRPDIALRWTRLCFCGQQAPGGPVDSTPIIGLPQQTGSEEGRGPLYDDVTHVPFEGYTSPVETSPAQGHKIPTLPDAQGGLPRAVPLMGLRIADRMIVSVPGEMSEAMGRRVRDSVLDATRAGGIHAVVISGLANEYLSYFVTPEEYERQHYEGGSTLFGRWSSNLLLSQLTELASATVGGRDAMAPYAYDPTNGVKPDAADFPGGASTASVASQPEQTERLGHAVFRWHGGLRGADRPLDDPFVIIQRRIVAKHSKKVRWGKVDDDLGLDIVWRVDDSGTYTAQWEAPISARRGTYRFAINARHYRLESAPFALVRSTALTVRKDGGDLVVGYPGARYELDFTYRPTEINGGRVTFDIGRGVKRVSVRHGGRFRIPPGATGTLAAGAIHDRYGNANGQEVTP